MTPYEMTVRWEMGQVLQNLHRIVIHRIGSSAVFFILNEW